MITIVDYGMGNLRSVQKAFERVGASARISSDPESVRAAERLVLPGVGAFGDAVKGMRERGLIEPIVEFLQADRPFLGICLGLQLLFDESEEGAEPCRGLGVIPGRVVRFPADVELKVPHMGWNEVEPKKTSRLLDGIPAGTRFYFVHSYYVVPAHSGDVWLETEYIKPFCSAVERGAIHATQFHPEKSQRWGLKLLDNFASL